MKRRGVERERERVKGMGIERERKSERERDREREWKGEDREKESERERDIVGSLLDTNGERTFPPGYTRQAFREREREIHYYTKVYKKIMTFTRKLWPSVSLHKSE